MSGIKSSAERRLVTNANRRLIHVSGRKSTHSVDSVRLIIVSCYITSENVVLNLFNKVHNFDTLVSQ